MRTLLSLAFFALVFVTVRCESNDTSSTSGSESTSTPKADSTTTSVPVTSTHAPLTTTPMPEPAARKEPQQFKYEIKGENNSICLLAELAVQIEVKYNNTKGRMETAYLNLLNTSATDENVSKCSENKTKFAIEINGDKDDLLIMELERSDKSYYVNKVTLNLDGKTIDSLMPLVRPHGKMVASMENVTLFKAPEDYSYQCKAEESETMHATDDFTVTLRVKDVRIDAFRGKETTNKFRNGKLCAADEDISDVIPIAVGAALAALVVIVLIAYFIGRRRSRRLAYQSV